MTTAVVLDHEALVRLGRDVGDGTFAASFARRYRTLLPCRVERVLTALGEPDLVAAMDAVLSLKVSSTTIGAGELVCLAVDLEEHVRREDVAGARSRAACLQAAASRAESAVSDYLEACRAG